MRGVALVLFGLVLMVSSVEAAPRELRNVSPMRVRLNNQSTPAFGLKPDRNRDGWGLQLATCASCTVELIDATPGEAPRKYSVRVLEGEAFLDARLFVAGHVYRVVLRHWDEPIGGNYLLYLHSAAPRDRRQVHSVSFGEDDLRSDAGHDDGIQTIAKGSL